ncbi:preprotein translocase subunit SecG [Candidatus Tisiphia endosymbiont of Hybos culiciformis]|uniref:preprotein translocase subunit SecG n=1 Tax=Candidatus Tisiphia endosymbiont of Hybos culiciformis TaxID=3139331 RepID=UPI003CCACF90
MMNILLFVHIVIAILLIIVILMQKTGSDGLSGVGGGNGTMGVVAGRTVVNFLTKTTVVLATLFIINAIILANLSSKKNPGIIKKIEQVDDKQQESSLPIAK